MESKIIPLDQEYKFHHQVPLDTVLDGSGRTTLIEDVLGQKGEILQIDDMQVFHAAKELFDRIRGFHTHPERKKQSWSNTMICTVDKTVDRYLRMFNGVLGDSNQVQIYDIRGAKHFFYQYEYVIICSTIQESDGKILELKNSLSELGEAQIITGALLANLKTNVDFSVFWTDKEKVVIKNGKILKFKYIIEF